MEKYKCAKGKLCLGLKWRIWFVVLLALSYNLLIYTFLIEDARYHWQNQIFTFCFFMVTSEAILLYDNFISRWFPLHSKEKKRFALLLGFIVIWIYLIRLVIPIIEPLFLTERIVDTEAYNLAIVIGILYILFYVAIIIARNYHFTLSYYIVENERLNKEKLRNDYKALQDQINPHFLFNNLSTLIAIIRKDKDTAIEFTENFTDVYRYVLNSNKELSVTLGDEVEFLKSYVALHKARLGDGVLININVDEHLLTKRLPPLSLQMLVENAIKHNITSRSQPLSINIQSERDRVVVSNTRQLKEATYSTNTGMANLDKRFEILTDQKLEVVCTDSLYRVSVPLLKK